MNPNFIWSLGPGQSRCKPWWLSEESFRCAALLQWWEVCVLTACLIKDWLEGAQASRHRGRAQPPTLNLLLWTRVQTFSTCSAANTHTNELFGISEYLKRHFDCAEQRALYMTVVWEMLFRLTAASPVELIELLCVVVVVYPYLLLLLLLLRSFSDHTTAFRDKRRRMGWD